MQRYIHSPFHPQSHLGPLLSSLGCFSKFPKIPMLSCTPNMALFSFQRSATLGGGKGSLTCSNPGAPREKLVQAGGTQPRASACAPSETPCHHYSLSPMRAQNTSQTGPSGWQEASALASRSISWTQPSWPLPSQLSIITLYKDSLLRIY